MIPFAGEYVLGGRLAELNEYLAAPERIEAEQFYDKRPGLKIRGVLLNRTGYLDLSNGQISQPSKPVDKVMRRQYIENELKDRSYSFESDQMPKFADFKDLVPTAFDHSNENG